MSVNFLKVRRPTSRGVRYLKLRFDDGKISVKDAQKWARSIARQWGDINQQKKVQAEGLPGPAWLFSCSGHGGYIMVAPVENVPKYLHRFAVDGLAVYKKDWVAVYDQLFNGMSVFMFEEDCDFAVFEHCYPQVLNWHVKNREEEWAKAQVILTPHSDEDAVWTAQRAALARARLKNPEEMEKLIQQRANAVRLSVEEWQDPELKKALGL